MRGAALTLSEGVEEMGAEGWKPSVVLVSDMVDLPALRAFTRDTLSDVPFVLYFHESQLTYPDSPLSEPDLSYAVTNWLSAAAADLVVFNSEFHRREFFSQLPRLLRHFPDYTHLHRVPEVEAWAQVLPVGVELSWVEPGRRQEPPLVVWNHRWEHDKNPGEFLSAVVELADEGVPFRLALCGESFRQRPVEFEEAGSRLGERVIQFGWAPLSRYREILSQAAVVVSTAHQEFFGVSVVEAAAAGAHPVLPHRLSYPELIPAELHPVCLYPAGGLVPLLRQVLTDPDLRQEVSRRLAPVMRRFDWSQVAPRYDRLLEEVS
jgi:glycosyltransferase involved in cell wall biosynthesis